MYTKDKKIFKKEVLLAYNEMMSKLYLSNRDYTSNEVRLRVLAIITSHIAQKSVTALKAKTRLRTKVNAKLQKDFDKNFIEIPIGKSVKEEDIFEIL